MIASTSDMPPNSDEITALNWTTNIDQEDELRSINWGGLIQYAIDVRTQRDEKENTCQLSSEYNKHNKDGFNLVRRLDFQDGIRWVARIQLHISTLESAERLIHKVHIIAVV